MVRSPVLGWTFMNCKREGSAPDSWRWGESHVRWHRNVLTFYFGSATGRSVVRFENHSSHLRRNINVIQKSEVSGESFKARHHHSVTGMRLANLWSVGLDHVRRDIHTYSLSVISTFFFSGTASVLATANFIYSFIYFFFQPAKFMFTVAICVAELGHVGRRTTRVCHVNPPFDAYFHIRRGAQRKATATLVPPSRDLLTTFCMYKKKNQKTTWTRNECEDVLDCLAAGEENNRNYLNAWLQKEVRSSTYYLLRHRASVIWVKRQDVFFLSHRTDSCGCM